MKRMLRRLYLSSRYPRSRAPQGRQKLSFLVKLMLVFAGAVLLVFLFEARLAPGVERMASARVSYLAGKAINDAVDDQIRLGDIRYDDLILLEKDAEGHITALKTNMVKINQLKAEINNYALEKINNISASELSIPLGNLLGSRFFSGKGPKIPIWIVSVGSVDARFASRFSSAGINQTLHQIIIEVDVDISALLPGFSAGTTVSTQVTIAETVIVGTVPNTYTYLEDTGMDGMDIYGTFDLDGP